MKREFEYTSYPEKERRAVLENSGAELERMLTHAPRPQAPGQAATRHVAPRHSGAERDTGRRLREQRGADRADAKNPNRRDVSHDPDVRRRRWDAGGPDAYSARHGREPGCYDGDGDYDEDLEEVDDEATVEGYADADYEDYEDEEDYDREPDEADGEYDDDCAYNAADGGFPVVADDGYHPGAAPGFAGGERRSRGAGGAYRRAGGGYRGTAVFHVSGAPGYGAGIAGAEPGEYGADRYGPDEYGGDGYGGDGYGGDGYGAGGGPGEPDERTEVLINRGRRHARPTGVRRALVHWRAIGVAIAVVTIVAVTLAMIVPGNDATWPPSVAVVEKEITVACENPNVVAEPTQVNFACAKDTRPILWVFSLLTSGDNPDYSDAANGRKGLEPITPAQGGDIAWSLNLHHPYDPANPVDSLEVAARAINNIIGGATVTGSNGAPVVQPGLESTTANCARYTGSSSLVTRQGFPAVCAQPVASPGGQAALVSDVFQQWMVGTPAQVAAEAGVLFENADNPGDPRVEAILKALPQTGL